MSYLLIFVSGMFVALVLSGRIERRIKQEGEMPINQLRPGPYARSRALRRGEIRKRGQK